MTGLTERDLADAAEVMAQAAEGQAAERAAHERRNLLIRQWRARGVPSRAIEEALGIGRSSVLKINART